VRILEPIRGRVIVKRIERNITTGGLALPDNRQQETVEGEVIFVGAGLRTAMTGEFIEPQVEVGDTVLYWANDSSLIPIDFEGQKYDVISDDQSIIAKIKEIENES